MGKRREQKATRGHQAEIISFTFESLLLSILIGIHLKVPRGKESVPNKYINPHFIKQRRWINSIKQILVKGQKIILKFLLMRSTFSRWYFWLFRLRNFDFLFYFLVYFRLFKERDDFQSFYRLLQLCSKLSNRKCKLGKALMESHFY